MTMEQSIAAIRRRMDAAALEVGRDPGEITLVAATKTQTSQTIQAAIANGITVCGENRVQELTAHLDDYAYDGAQVHFIGNLQTNKVKFVVGRVDLVESVDSLRLLEAIDKQAGKLARVQEILLEVNIAGESSKGGCPVEEVYALAHQAREMEWVRLRGLMVIPPPAVEVGQNRTFFQKTQRLLVDIREKIGDNDSEINCLSMGMSGDFEDAIREGATLVRVGRALFGERPSK